jgi:hypothetical protein
MTIFTLVGGTEQQEVEAVISILATRANIEIDQGLASCPAVDTLFAFLLKHYRLDKATEVCVCILVLVTVAVVID